MKFNQGKTAAVVIMAALALVLSSCSMQRRADYNNYSNNIVNTAKKYLGVSYKYGGNDPGGFDCSGFTMYVYKKNRIRIPRSTNEQFTSGKRVKIREANPGDLVFFDINGRGISHVGIYTGNYRFIHAPRTGKNVSYANLKNPYWKKRFKGIVTYQ
jgi:cell wall-associated NlpC family hydrolase